MTKLDSHTHPGQGILIELLLTMLLVMVFLHTTMERSECRPVAPVVIGLALTAAVISRYMYIHVLMKEGSKKEASKVKQTTRQSNTAHLRLPKKCTCTCLNER